MPNKRARSDRRVLPGGLPGKVGAPNQQKKLLARLKAAEETLLAIRSGEVDALMVAGRRRPKVVTLAGGEPAYRILVEAMSEGAATLSRNGAVLYCNRRFAELICRPPKKVIGAAVRSLVAETERDRIEALLAEAQKGVAKGEFNLRRRDGSLVPVNLSLNRFRGYEGRALGMVVTDLSEQKRTQAAEIKQAAEMHRLLLERAFTAQEEERRRIARELHDEAGQLLASLLVGLRTLEDSAKIPRLKTQGHRLRKLAARAIEEIGRLARGLHPMVLDDHGLGVALTRYAAEYTETHKIAVHLTLSGLNSSNLPRAVQIRLYRILQEALTNVARHAGAKKVSITFARSATALKVAVIDDGCGFDAGAAAASSHRLGIQGMRERAAMLGGTVSFTSQGKGTRVLVQIPLHKQGLQPLGGRART
ncbi:MAG: PAS domain-containing sensor histidine kinase [Acidobacteriia bacterium]|nr:PAS domain-containing sensor histidine kinase [Terriglobia bacterium]